MSDKKDFNKKYEKMNSSLQVDLVRMQEWVIAEKKKLVIIKGGDHSLSSPKYLTVLKKELKLMIN